MEDGNGHLGNGDGAAFRPAWWLRGGHAQTLFASLTRRRVDVDLHRERVELPDGDFLDLDWYEPEGCGVGVADAPLVLILHGLEGSSDSHYVRGMLRELGRMGVRGVVMHFRGCGGEPNRLRRAYHSGETGDLEFVVAELRRREEGGRLGVVGYSIGGNVLLKWLGEKGAAAAVDAAVAVSVPFDLTQAADRMSRGFSRIYQRKSTAHAVRRLSRGFSRIYQRRLVRCLQQSVLEKMEHIDLALGLDEDELRAMRSFWEFDDRVTARLHGFEGADDYYERCSSRAFMKSIERPTLVLHARNDPFMTEAVIPTPDELAASVRFELADDGGHVGFVCGRWPWAARYWLEERVPEYLRAYLL
jgi:predicted alpha/beta-fold hydrolase